MDTWNLLISIDKVFVRVLVFQGNRVLSIGISPLILKKVVLFGYDRFFSFLRMKSDIVDNSEVAYEIKRDTMG